ncbi:hypothetical protein [Cupriavidus sp. BIC8F]|uniref:hypothetical protein n=1 Tax=Cupriavidus sp. BIC8F TaxID=3079014 RepID=UPI002916F7C9|nr:hypothetical protein [Cupriavidus sp. BIC8F]
MKPQHTAGPWHADRRDILTTENQCIATVWSGAAASLDEADANERLFAAGPDLLAAAIAAEAIFTRQRWRADSLDPEALAMRALRAAIAKAIGGTRS